MNNKIFKSGLLSLMVWRHVILDFISVNAFLGQSLLDGVLLRIFVTFVYQNKLSQQSTYNVEHKVNTGIW